MKMRNVPRPNSPHTLRLGKTLLLLLLNTSVILGGVWKTDLSSARVFASNMASASSSSGQSVTLGFAGTGTSIDTGDSGYMNGSKVVVGSQSVAIRSISVYVGAVDKYPHNFYGCAIYTDNNGTPSNLVASCLGGTLTANSWNTRPVLASLAANTTYWLVYLTNGSSGSVNNMAFNQAPTTTGSYAVNPVQMPSVSGTVNSNAVSSSFAKIWPTSFGSASLGAWDYSIYASGYDLGSGATSTATSLTPAPTNTPVPTTSATALPSMQPTSTASASPTPTATATTPSATQSPSTATPTATATATPSNPTSQASGTVTSIPQPTSTGSPTSISANVPVPTALTVEQDDQAAILSWNGPVNLGWPDPHGNPTGVSGYKVSWGLVGQPMSNTSLTEWRLLELQPLVNGEQYQAEVQAIDESGNLSVPSQVITFTGDPSRVNALQAQMTGFFDNFNDPAGPFNELKWNSAYSACDNPLKTGVFINSQFHAHNMIDATNCDRGQNVSRPRAVFDFTGRTGTITFDMDGSQRRDQWYLDLVPNLMDVTGQVAIEGGGQNGPANMLRFHQNGQTLEILYIDSSGMENSLATGSTQNGNILLVPNVRRHFVLHVSQNYADIEVNGQIVVSTTNLSLPFSKAYLLWNAFSYNTPKSNEPDDVLHWDNFGFDGPASTTETHNYIDANYQGGGDFAPVQASIGQPYGVYTTTIPIPDALTGATAERMMFSMQMATNQWYTWDPGDQVIVNGHAFSIPQPNDAPISTQVLVSGIEPYSVVISVPVGTLTTGTNTIVFKMKSSGVLNVHTEIDFPAGHAPSYSQPGTIYPTLGNVDSNIGEVGPGAILASVNGQALNISSTLAQQPQSEFSASKTVALELQVANDIAMDASGKNPGITQVQLLLDGNPIYTFNAPANGSPLPSYDYTFNLDTTKYANGVHSLQVVAVNSNGGSSIPDYFQADVSQGQVWPIGFTIAN